MTPEQDIAATRKRLGHLAGLAHRSTQAERAIRTAAEHRLKTVSTDLAKLGPRAVLDDDAGKQFAELTRERGQLQLVIAQARAVLAQ